MELLTLGKEKEKKIIRTLELKTMLRIFTMNFPWTQWETNSTNRQLWNKSQVTSSHPWDLSIWRMAAPSSHHCWFCHWSFIIWWLSSWRDNSNLKYRGNKLKIQPNLSTRTNYYKYIFITLIDGLLLLVLQVRFCLHGTDSFIGERCGEMRWFPLIRLWTWPQLQNEIDH